MKQSDVPLIFGSHKKYKNCIKHSTQTLKAQNVQTLTNCTAGNEHNRINDGTPHSLSITPPSTFVF